MAWLGFKKSPHLQWLEKGVDCGDPHITSHCSEKGPGHHTTVFWSQVLFDSVFFSGTIWDVGSCSQQADPLFQNRNHFGGGKNDFTFPRLRDSFCFATAHEPVVLLLREKMSYWRLTKKDNYKLSLRWCLVSPKQHSSPPGARQLTEYPEEEVKEQGWSRQV